MKIPLALMLAGTLTLISTAYAQQQTPAQKLAPILPAQPPQVSTTTKPSAAGQPASLYHAPAAPTIKQVDTIRVPPPARSAPNPQNDPDVARGIRDYKKPGT